MILMKITNDDDTDYHSDNGSKTNRNIDIKNIKIMTTKAMLMMIMEIMLIMIMMKTI